LSTVYALVEEVAGPRGALKISDWTPSMTVSTHFKHCGQQIMSVN